MDKAVCGYQIKEEEKKIRGVSWKKKTLQTNRDCTRAVNVVIAPTNSKKKKQQEEWNRQKAEKRKQKVRTFGEYCE